MSSNCPPQLHLELPPNTTSFKRSFDQFGFDLDSPLGASDATQGGSGSNGHDRNKRARSASSFSDDNGSINSSQSSTIASGSSSMGPDAQDSSQSALAATRPTAVLSAPSFSITLTRAPLEPPRLPTPEIQDIDMADYTLVSDHHDSEDLPSPSGPSTSTTTTHPPAASSQADESYRLSLERFNAFDSQISALRRSQSPTPPRAPASPPVLPPLELSDDRELNTTSIPFLHPPTEPSPSLPEALYSRAAQSSRRDDMTSSAQAESSNGPSTGDAPHLWDRATNTMPWIRPAGFRRSSSPVPAIGELRSPSPLFEDLEFDPAATPSLTTNPPSFTGPTMANIMRRTPVHAPPPTLPLIESNTGSDEEDTWDYEDPLDRLRIFPTAPPPISPHAPRTHLSPVDHLQFYSSLPSPSTPPHSPRTHNDALDHLYISPTLSRVDTPPVPPRSHRTHARDQERETPIERDGPSVSSLFDTEQWTPADEFLSSTRDGPYLDFDSFPIEHSFGPDVPRRNESSRTDAAPQRNTSSSSNVPTQTGGGTGARSSRTEAHALQGLGEALRGLGRALQESEITLRPLLDFGSEAVVREGESSRGRTSAWRDVGSRDGTGEAVPRRLRLNSSLAGSPLESHMRPWLQERRRSREISPPTPPSMRYDRLTERYMQSLRDEISGTSTGARPPPAPATLRPDPGPRAERDDFNARAARVQRTDEMLNTWLREDAEQEIEHERTTRPVRREASSERDRPSLSWVDNTTIEIRQSPSPEPESAPAPTAVPASTTAAADPEPGWFSWSWNGEADGTSPETMDTGLFGVRPVGTEQQHRSSSSASGMALSSPSTLLRLRSRPYIGHSHSHSHSLSSRGHSHSLSSHSTAQGHGHTRAGSASSASGPSVATTFGRNPRLELQRQNLGLSEPRPRSPLGEPVSFVHRGDGPARSAWQNHNRQNSGLAERAHEPVSTTRGASSGIRPPWHPPPRPRYLESMYRTGPTEHSSSASSNLVDMAMDLDTEAPTTSTTSRRVSDVTSRLEDGPARSRRAPPPPPLRLTGLRSGSRRIPSPPVRNDRNWGRIGGYRAEEAERLLFASYEEAIAGRRDSEINEPSWRDREEERGLERFLSAPSLPSPGLGGMFEFPVYEQDQQGRRRDPGSNESEDLPSPEWYPPRRSPSPPTVEGRRRWGPPPRRASPVRPPGARVIHPDSFAPGPMRNTVQSIYESNMARESRIAASQAQPQQRSEPWARYNPPSIPPLAFDDDFTTLYPGEPAARQEEGIEPQDNRTRPQRPPSGSNRLSSYAESYAEESSFFGRWMERERSRHRSSSQGPQSTWSLRPSTRSTDESNTTATETSRRPSDIHSFLARRPRFEGSRLDNPNSTQAPQPRGDEDGLSRAIAVLRHDGLSSSRSSELMNALRVERERDTQAATEATTRDVPSAPSSAQSAQWGDIAQNTRHGLSWEVDPLRSRWTRPTPAPAPADPFAPRYVRASATTASDMNPSGSAMDRSRIAASMRARRARRRPLDEPGSMLFPGLLHEHFRLAGFGRRGRPLGDYMRDEDFDESYESLLSLAASLGEAKPRATPDGVIAGLETGLYKDWKTADSDHRCPICLDDYEPEDTLLKLSDCSHWLHRECLQQWLKGASTCPVCRKTVKGSRRTPHHHHHHSNEPGPSRRRGPDDGPGGSGSGNDSSNGPGIGEWMAPPWRYGQGA
ncbi:hypothetical protein Hypma_013932 [Hypsizygus marmoreus]|uniref:RING-type domain-containing protein n=1 Tax=Hypsizygus marmoreus TaxID=39966 RepID=A0A369KDM3_HYPMA|nr:hypothetical protein Hypma_013932 [Hypsizygus marmoreus]